jgi:hypothetical protein
MFLLLAAARGSSLSIACKTDSFATARVWRARVIVASIVLLGSFLIPYRKTTHTWRSSRFSQLPSSTEGQILAIFGLQGGDYDCCLALPIPRSSLTFPISNGGSWGKGTSTVHLRDLQFDYLRARSSQLMSTASIRGSLHFAFDPEMNAQRAQLRRLQSIDEFIRPTRSSVTAGYNARTRSAGHPSSCMTLTIYRRASPADNPR